MIVIDVGCARYGGDYSIERLIEEFHPHILYGFDPNPVVPVSEMYEVFDDPVLTKVVLERKAAWIYDGEIGYVDTGLGSWITERTEEMRVKCLDLARFILELPKDEIALKMDAEGAEYEILEHLIATGANEMLSLVWLEWHPAGAPVNSRPDERRDAIEEGLGCELHQWNW